MAVKRGKAPKIDGKQEAQRVQKTNYSGSQAHFDRQRHATEQAPKAPMEAIPGAGPMIEKLPVGWKSTIERMDPAELRRIAEIKKPPVEIGRMDKGR